MQIDIFTTAGVITAFSAIGGVLFGLFKFYLGSKQQKDEIKQIKREQTVICYALTACLNGLEQLGADGEVHDALTMMNKHINQAAHDQDRSV